MEIFKKGAVINIIFLNCIKRKSLDFISTIANFNETL